MEKIKIELKDGKKVYVTEVLVEKIHFVNGKGETNAETSNTDSTVATPNTDDFVPITADDESDLPF